MELLQLSCLRATELIEKKQTFGLTIHEHIKLNFRTMLCDACAAYKKQSTKLESMIKSRFALANNPKIETKINTELKQRINKAILSKND